MSEVADDIDIDAALSRVYDVDTIIWYFSNKYPLRGTA